jgi:probable HAF family extracellular repeat protein
MKLSILKEQWSRIKRLSLVLVVFAGPALAQQKSAPPRYTITPLGTLGGSFSLAYGINNNGEIDGFSTLPGDAVVHSFVLRNGVMIDLGTLGGANSQSFTDLNEATQVVGSVEIPTPDPKLENFCGFGTNLTCLGFLWQNGVMAPLSTLGGANGAAAGINQSGQIAGYAETDIADPGCPAPQVLQYRPVVWTNGKIQTLPMYGNDTEAAAFSINNGGEVAGASGVCALYDGRYGLAIQPQHALLWHNGQVIDLGNLGGKINNSAFAINDRGDIVGGSDLPDDTYQHGFLWQAGKMTDLKTLPGDVVSAGLAINNRGQITGVSMDPDGNIRGYLWENGVMTDLNTLIPDDSPWYILHGFGINDEGQIVGFALQTEPPFEVHGFLATPIGNSAAAGGTKAKVRLPESARKQLLLHLHSHRFGLQVPAPQ